MYNKDLDKLHLDVTFVKSAMKYHVEGTYQQATNVPLDSFLWNNRGAVSFTSSTENKMGSTLSENQMASYLGRINYAFNNKYLLTLSGRYD